MGTQSVVRLSDVEKAYRGFHWGPVELELEPGLIYALMGPNGAGKSSLFRMLSGMIYPDKGSVALFGSEANPDRMDVKEKIAYMPEELDLPDLSWTLRDWVGFVSEWYPGWNHVKCRELTARYGLEWDKKIRTYSKGIKRKAAFIVALSQEPDLLLLDEPASGLDPFAWRMMMEDLVRFMEDGTRTILIATPTLEEIRRLADMVAFLYEGRLLGVYEKDTLLDSWRMYWVDGLPQGANDLPGVVAVEPELPIRLISRSPAVTEQALTSRGVVIHESRFLELDEIFSQLVRIKQKSRS